MMTPTNIVVQKYGGSSVADTDKIKQVAARIARTKRAGKKVVVVVSAMGKTTNQLIEKAKQVSPSPSRRELDMLLTCGVREAMSLLSMAVAEEGFEAISLARRSTIDQRPDRRRARCPSDCFAREFPLSRATHHP
jgi:aspartokinase